MKKVILILMLAIILIIPSIGDAEPNPQIHAATLAGNVGLGMVKMMDDAAKNGNRVNYEVYKTPDLAVGKLIAGELDFAGLPTSTAALLYNRGVGIQTVAIIGWGVMYVVSGDPSIKKWTDLKGKEVFVSTKGAISDVLLRYLISKNGLNPEKDMTIQYIASAVEIAQLTASGKITVAALPEPWVTEVLEMNPKLKVVLDFQKEWKRVEKQGFTYPQSCIVVRKQFAHDHPESVRWYLGELEQSIGWVNRNPKLAGVLADKYVQIKPLAAEKGMKRSNLRYNDAYQVKGEVDHFLQRLVDFAPDSIGGKVPDEEGFYYRP